MKVLSRQEIIDMMADGKVIVIYKNQVLNLTSWLPRHPGGDKAVLHMVGRDATDEMIAYHGEDTVKMFSKWKIGYIDYMWENLLPPIQGADYSHGIEIRQTQDLESRLDIATDESEGDIISSSSSSVDLNDARSKSREQVKVVNGPVTPKVPQNLLITPKNKDKVFPLFKNETVINPKLLMDKYDNKLSQEEMVQLPDLDYKTQQNLRDEYNKLHKVVIENGFYQCIYWNYVCEILKLIGLFLYALSFYKLGYFRVSAIIIGIAWQQGTFIAHDAGHISITHDYQLDNMFGIFIADFFGGLSLGWWKRNHNVHHLITNDPVHDPDIQHLPFFAVSTRLFNNVYSTYYEKTLWFDKASQFLIQFQNYLYYPILTFARFNLYVLSWSYILKGEGPTKGKAAWFRYFEFVGLSFFAYWYFYLLIYKGLDNNWQRFQFLMLTNIASFIVHVQITLSHFAMSTADFGVSESFPMRQIRTTMDVDCPEWLDFFHGGLQFQAIHHLFPRIPRHNLRRVQPFVIDFCKKMGLKYAIYGFGEGNEIVINKLGDIAKQCSILVDATRKYGENDDFF